MKRLLLAGVLLVFALAVAQDKKSITQAIMADKDFSTLATALKETGLDKTLDAEAGPFTIFAPTDAAFAKLPKERLDALLKDKAKLTKLLQYHVISGKSMGADVTGMDGKAAKTLEGGELKIAAKDGKATINEANLTKADIEATNGVIHVIDTVLMPEGL